MSSEENGQGVSSWGWTIAAIAANAMVVLFFVMRIREIEEMTANVSLGHYAGLLAFCLPLLYPLWRLWARRSAPWGMWTKSLVVFALFYPVFAELHSGASADLMLKRYRKDTVYGLSDMRSALSGHLRKNGAPPEDLSEVVPEIPRLILPYTGHKGTHAVRVSESADIQDTGSWLYVKNASSSTVLIDCTHEYDRLDGPRRAWSSF